MLSDKELLIKTRQLINNPKNWFKITIHKKNCDKDCKIVNHQPNIVGGVIINQDTLGAYDLNQALLVTCRQNELFDRYGNLFWKLNNLTIKYKYMSNLFNYNDEHTHAEILALLDLAIDNE